MSSNPPAGSTKPYLLRAIYEWCTDNGFTPYLAVKVDGSVRVPLEYVKNGEIVLNIGFEATSGLHIDNDAVHFKARFGGVARELFVPVDRVAAIYARENGQGMAFPVDGSGQDAIEAPEATDEGPADDAGGSESAPSATVTPLRAVPPVQPATPPDEPPPAGPRPGGGSRLTRVK